MIQKRLQEEDCNAGAMFDCLTSENWPDIKFAIGAIFQACGKQNVQVVLFTHKEKQEESENIDAKFDLFNNPEQIKPVEDTEEVKVKEKVVDAKKPTKPGKLTLDKKKSQLQSKEKKDEHKLKPEEEKKAKDLEMKKRRAEALIKSGFKPPVYTEDEKNQWRNKALDYQNFVTDLIKKSVEGEVGFRKLNEQPIHQNLLYTCEDMKKIVQEP